jgi:hypothetical protein
VCPWPVCALHCMSTSAGNELHSLTLNSRVR